MRAMRRLAGVAAIVAAGALMHVSAGWAAVPWCGNDQLSTDRPDVLGGHKIHVIYAVPSDGVDRFRDVASPIVSDVASITEWWRREDPSREPRWDLFPFPGCPPGLGTLDLTFVRLQQPAGAYADSSTRQGRLLDDLGAAIADPAKKYLVYYDGAVPQEDLCGRASGDPARGGRFGVATVFMQGIPPPPLTCGTFGDGGYGAKTATHELLHALGAVPPGAPHACPGSHVCDSPVDVMLSGGASLAFADYRLDVGRDDYYGHGGAWWDVQDSAWLATDAPNRLLSVEVVAGRGSSSVSSDPAGLDCRAACSLPWPNGDQVTLEAEPDDGQRFVRWQGACSGGDTCTLVLDADKAVRAVFGPDSYRLTLQVRGRGKVVSGFLRPCRGRCAGSIPAGEAVGLRAVADRGWRLSRWTGCKPRLRNACRLRMTRNALVVAVFVRR
jgi:List-Bact-rpt repeat protein